MDKGYEGIKSPKFIVFTDKDGTLNLQDERLVIIFRKIQLMGGMVIPITGRTVGDIIEELKNNDIPLPPIIIGDNGGGIYLTRKNEFIQKKLLNHKDVINIIDKFLEFNGKPELIRYTDGKNIYASKRGEAKGYYKNSKAANLCDNIYDSINSSKEISKITLAGSKEEMEQMAEFVANLGFWTDMDETKFPNKKDKKTKNYRLDITVNDINKGETVKTVARELRPNFYVCVGNGKNDLSMFEQALKDGQDVAIIGDSEEVISVTRKIKERIGGKGKIRIVPNKEDNLANRYIERWAELINEKLSFKNEVKIPRSELSGNKLPTRHRNRQVYHIR